MSTPELLPSDINILQLSDSFFPSGMYSMSSGLETIFYMRKISSEEQLKSLIMVYLKNQFGPADCVALGNAYEAAKDSDLERLIEVDQMIYSMKLVHEIRDASVRSGSQMLKCIGTFAKSKILDAFLESIQKGYASGIYPVVLGAVSAAFGIPKKKAGLMLMYSFVVSIVGAALRLGMTNHFVGQKIINESGSTMIEMVNLHIDNPLVEMRQFIPQLDILQITHEQSDNRMFVT
jgi:urease accessory protein